MTEEGINKRLERAVFYREALATVMRDSGLNLAALCQQGCLCCDVGAGAEIAALLPLKPAPFYASEQHNDYFESEKDEARLSELGSVGDFELIKDTPERALRALANQGVKVGLITWLRIYPTKISENKLVKFFRLAQPLLKPGGAVVVSVGYSGDIDDYRRGSSEIEGGREILAAGSRLEALGYRVDYLCRPVGSGQSAGGFFSSAPSWRHSIISHG